MKPHASPISCKTYFVNDFSLSTNPVYDAEQPSDVSLDDLEVESEILAPSPEGDWIVVLAVEQHVPTSKNAPYNFSIQVWGYFEVVPGLSKERAEQLVLTNGSSILFAATREILRDMTSKGPYPPLLLPTLSFFPLPKKESAATAEPKPSLTTPESNPGTISVEDGKGSSN